MSSRRPVSGREIRLKTLGILAGIAVGVATVAFVQQYRILMQHAKDELAELARSQARVIEAVARYDAIHAEPGDNPRAITLSQLREAQYQYRGFGRTGELVLAERRDSLIHFLLPMPDNDFRIPEPVPLEGGRSTLTRLAVLGESGVGRGVDYRGVEVVAAYEYLPFLGAGLVAKMDVAEVRAPVFRAALITLAAGLLAILVGVLLQERMVGPLVRFVLSSNVELASGLRSVGAQSERYATVFRSSADPIIIEDLQGRVLELNRAAEEAYGWSSAELVGQSITVLSPPELHAQAQARLQRCLRGDEVRDEAAMRLTKSGERRDVLLTLSLLKDEDGRPMAISTMAKDITELRQAQLRLEEANRGLEAEVRQRTDALEHELRVARALAEEARRGAEIALVGDSIQVRALREQIARFAATDDAILLGGPPGSGQESVARALHEGSARASRPFIVVDCSRPIGEDTTPLLGLTQSHDAGKISIADGGTLYLDLVGLLPPDLQASLAQFLRDSAEARARGETPQPDVRFIAYLPADVHAAVATGDLHPDLGQVLSRRRVVVPSLSERREDIEVIANRVLQIRARALAKPAASFSDKAIRTLLDYSWPGNIRELQSIVDRAVLVSTGVVVDVEEDLRQQTRTVGGYRLLRLVGRGGMGEVWLAEHALLKRPAAVKLTQAHPGESPEQRAALERRFRREAEVTARLRSPHTVELYDFGVTEDGRFYYVMEFLEGLDLNTLVQVHGAVPPERAVHLVYQACLSLGEAHEAGLVHRDIKPENLFACRMGQNVDFVKVLDFGIVKQTNATSTTNTGTGVIIGTPAYLAPEVASGGAPTALSDIYALGCVLFRLVTGRPVFDEDSAMSMLLAHVERQPDVPSQVATQPIPEDLDQLILSCLAKDPAQRPQSALELRTALRTIPLAAPWTEERAQMWWEQQTQVRSITMSPDLSTKLLRG